MAGTVYIIYDPFRDVDLRETLREWCESGGYQVIDWTPSGAYGDTEQEMSRVSMKSCEIALVIVGKANHERSIHVEANIARELNLVLLQLVSPRASVPYLPGAGVAVGWSREELLGKLNSISHE